MGAIARLVAVKYEHRSITTALRAITADHRALRALRALRAITYQAVLVIGATAHSICTRSRVYKSASMMTKRTPQYTDLILQGLRRGWSVAKICAMGKAGLLNDGDAPDPNFPARRCVWDWFGVDPQFEELYLAARRAGCEAMVDDGLVIVDDHSADEEWCISEKTGELVKTTDHEHVQRSRLRADYRKWYVAKLVPRLYGERVEIEHKGNVELVSRLTAGRARAALGGAQPAQLDDMSNAAHLPGSLSGVRDYSKVQSPVLIEGSAVRVTDDGSELV